MKKILLLLTLLHYGSFIHSQSPFPTAKIDSIFTSYHTNKGPGCSVCIVRNDSILYSKGYGMANLEYDISNTPNSVFNVASMSKQFTAYAIILLAQQNKLSLNDDIRKYLKWFPDLNEKITIQHLLNHTSGIRDQWDLVNISGAHVTTQEQIIKILGKQRALNFKPGEKYSYSNSNYTLLAEIVRSVAGTSFREFTDSALFRPLQMKSTLFHDNENELVKNRACGYNSTDKAHFENAGISSSIVGATGLFTSVKDLAAWIMNFYNPKVGDKKSIELLTQKGKLNSGEELTYARGVYVDSYKGWKSYYHGGAEPGYAGHLVVFPELKTGIVVLANTNDLNAQGIVTEIANILIPENTKNKAVQKNVRRDSLQTFLKDTQAVKKFAGSYISETGTLREIRFQNGQLYVFAQQYGNLLYPIDKGIYSLFAYPETRLMLYVDPLKKDTILERKDSYAKYQLKKYKQLIPTTQELQLYAGSYYCPELDSKQDIEFTDGKLILKYPRFDVPLTPIGNDHFLSGFCFVMLRNEKKEIIGFEINGERTLHLKFDRLSK